MDEVYLFLYYFVLSLPLCLAFAAAGDTQTGGKLPTLGAKVIYTVTLTNGLKTIQNTTGSLSSFLASGIAWDSTPGLACTLGGTSPPVQLNKLLPSPLSSGATIVCTFVVTVTNSHQQQGQIPGFNVSAAFNLTATDLSLAIKTLPVPAVPVATGSTLTVSGPTITNSYSIQGEHLEATWQQQMLQAHPYAAHCGLLHVVARYIVVCQMQICLGIEVVYLTMLLRAWDVVCWHAYVNPSGAAPGCLNA